MKKIRVNCLMNSMGLGGGDQLLFNILKTAPTLECRDFFAWREIPVDELRRAISGAPPDARFWLPDDPPRADDEEDEEPRLTHDRVTYCDVNEMVVTLAESCDVMITWLYPGVETVAPLTNVPIIDFVQGTTALLEFHAAKYAEMITKHVGVSAGSLMVLPPTRRGEAEVIYSGCDVNRVAPMKGRAVTRGIWRIEDNQKVLLHVGRLEAGKNARALIKAVAKLPPEWMGIMMGHGSEEMALREEAATYCPGRIGFVDPWAHVGDVMAAADVLVMVSDSEGDPIVIHEAHLAGLPVVATDLPTMREHRDAYGELCRYVPLQPTGEELANAIIEADSKDFRPIVARARRVTWENFTVQAVATRWAGLIEGVVTDHRRSAIAPTLEMMVGTVPVTIPAADLRVTGSKKIQIHCLYDAAGWAYHHLANALARRCPPQFEVTMGPADMPIPTETDVVFLPMATSAEGFREYCDSISAKLVTGMNVGPERGDRPAVAFYSHAVIHNSALGFGACDPPSEKDVYIPNGVCLRTFRPTTPITDRAKRVLWSGSKIHADLKGHGLMEQIRPMIKEAGWELDLHLADSHAAPKTPEEMADWYNTGSVFVVASASEGTPNPALEAAACGCSLAVTRVGNMPELVCNGKSGVFIKGRQPKRIFAMVKAAMEKREEYGPAIRKTIEQWWDWDLRAREYFQIFASVHAGMPMPPWSTDLKRTGEGDG